MSVSGSPAGDGASLTLRPLVWIAVGSLAWAVVLAFDWAPVLRGGFGWRWGYAPPAIPWAVALLLAAIALYLAGLARLLPRQSAGGLLAWTMLGSLVLTYAAQLIRGSPLEHLYGVTVSGVNTGWHAASTRVAGLSATLAAWPAFMRQAAEYSSHVSISPPGMVMVYHAAARLLEAAPPLAAGLARPLRALQCQDFALLSYSNAQLASAWLGVLAPVWAALTAWPALALGRRLLGEAAARRAVAWWPLVPGLALFAGSPNTLYPLFGVTVVLLLVRAFQSRQARWALAAGVVFSAWSLLSFAGLPLLFFCGLLVLGLCLSPAAGSAPPTRRAGSLRSRFSAFQPDGVGGTPSPVVRAQFHRAVHGGRGRGMGANQASAQIPSPVTPAGWGWAVQVGAWFGLGLSSLWLVLVFAARFPLAAFLRQATSTHLGLDRPYLPWVALHLNDVFMFNGWPLALAAALGAWLAGRAWLRRRPLAPGQVLALALAFTVLLLDVSGVLRGEAGRILLFFSPLVLLAASHLLAQVPAHLAPRAMWLLTLSQAAMLVVMAAFVQGISREFEQPSPQRPPIEAAQPAAPASPSGATFAGTLILRRFAGQVQATAGQPALALWLEWQAHRPTDRPYYLSLLPVAPGGTPASAAVVQPFAGQFPTTCWQPGAAPLADQVVLPLPAAVSGDWWVSLRWVDGDTGTTLPVVLPDGASDDQVGLGPFTHP